MNCANKPSSISSTSSNEPFVLGLSQPEESQEPAVKISRTDGHSVSIYQPVKSHLPAQSLQAHPSVSTIGNAYKCDHDYCHYSTNVKPNLKIRQRIHLSDDQRPKPYKCDHDYCHYSTNVKTNLKIHQRIHLSDDQRPKPYKCDQCVYSTDNKGHFNRHQQIHLPVDERLMRPKVHKCDHDSCGYSTDRRGDLKKHQQTHLLADQRPKVHKCDHNQCGYGTHNKWDLKRHQQTHQLDDQRPPRPQRPKVHKCEQCGYSTGYKHSLKLHQRTHLSDDQRPKHKCDHCDYSAYSKGHFYIHQLTHLLDGAGRLHQMYESTINVGNEVEAPDINLLSISKENTSVAGSISKENTSVAGCSKKTIKLDDSASEATTLPDGVVNCDHNYCCYSTGYKDNLKVHQQTNPPKEANEINDIEIIKEEPACNYWCNVKHRTDNRAPLWAAEPSIKQEFTEPEPSKKARTYFTQVGIPKKDGIRNRINHAISFYKGLNHEGREQYLNERLSVQKHDGSIFSELKDQDEVIANRDLAQWEILGHYAGKHYTDDSYNNGANSMGTILTNIDRYSFSTTRDQFISGFRSGNVTTLINACKTYNESENGRSLPEQNVSYMRHTDEQGKWIVFIIALKDIKAGVRLWADYGKQYWESMGRIIEISDSEDDAE